MHRLRVAALVVVLGALCLGAPAEAALSLVGGLVNTANGTSTSPAVGPNTYQAGNTVVIAIWWDASGTAVGTVTPPAGVTQQRCLDTASIYQCTFSADNIVGGSTTYTFTTTNSANWRMFVAEVSGTPTSNSFDGSADSATDGTSASRSSGTTGTLTGTSDFCLASYNGDGSGGTSFSSATNGFTIPTGGNALSGAGATPRGIITTNVITTSTAETTATFADPETSTGLITCYKAASGAQVVTPTAATPRSGNATIRFGRSIR